MHKNLLLFFIVFLVRFCLLCGDDVSIDSEVDQSNGVYENQPIRGIISVTHDLGNKIDESSFKLGNVPLPVEFVQDVRLSSSSPLVISYYQFNLDGKPKGLQILPSVSVTVGNKTYQSVQSTYQVEGAGSIAVPQTEEQGKKEKADKSILKVESLLEGPAALYPGTRFKAVYRYIFNDNFDLKVEKLPLLDGKGFLKIGTQAVEDSQQGAFSIRAISQALEAVQPGSYKFDGALVQGYVYRSDPFGGQYNLPTLYSANTPPMTIIVLPFPEKGKPASFNGAIGPFTGFNVSLKSSPAISVGDKIVLDVKITGKNMHLATAPLPDICCQPGFSGIFKLGDLPPVETVKGNVKEYVVEMRALTGSVKSIPSIEFSWFNSADKTYGSLRSKPIPISIKELAPPPPQASQPVPANQKPVQPKISSEPNPIEITGIGTMSPSDLQNRFFGQWWVLWILPLAAAALLGQKALKNYLKQRKPKMKPKTSDDIFQEAVNAGPGSSAFFQLLKAALMTKLVEKGIISNNQVNVEELPKEGLGGKIRALLLEIEEKRFTGQAGPTGAQWAQRAKELLEDNGK